MKIAFLTTEYNWESFSMARCAFETLKNRGIDVDLFFKKDPIIVQYDQIWLMSTGIYLTADEFKEAKGKVVSFGLSEPCNIVPEKRKNCHVYFTNDFSISWNMNIYWFPTSADIRYHKNLDLKKEFDVLFIGMGVNHPIGNTRLHVIEDLRKSGIQVKVYGDGWPEHPDNFPSIRGTEIVEQINKAKIMLDIASETSSLARRIFEGVSCGTAVLTRDRKDVRELFIPEEEISVYLSYGQISEKINLLLSNPKLLDKISKKGQSRCIIEHDISHRIDEIIKYLKGLL